MLKRDKTMAELYCLFVPSLGMTCSHVGNELFPSWEQTVPIRGTKYSSQTMQKLM